MLDAIKWIITSMWFFLNKPIPFEGYTLKIWYFIAYPIIVALFMGLLFKKNSNEKG